MKTPMPTQQKLLSLEVGQLKNIKDLHLDFCQGALTAIMGSNCSGKTTVLHALACAYGPIESASYSFPQFFRPNTDALWRGSDFTVRYSHRVGTDVHPDLSIRFTKANDRWSPRYVKRPARYTRFISIGESVPDMEVLNLNQMIHYQRVENTDEIGLKVREAAGQVLNRVYEALYQVTYRHRGKRSIGVKTSAATYSGLSMSSGEQRVFRILDAVFQAPRYALVLVDEIDLFLHQDALQRLLRNLADHCASTKKQLIFTTHFPPVAKMYDEMAVYTLHRSLSKTIVWKGYSYEALRHITGVQDRPISCYVEDDVAETIVARVATELGIRKMVQFGKYGPADNAFSLCAGLLLSNVSTERTLAILDGDKYSNRTERRARVCNALTGTGDNHDTQRRQLMSLIRALSPAMHSSGRALAPEQMLHRMLHVLERSQLPVDRHELFDIAMAVVNVPDRHDFVNKIIEQTGEARVLALARIVDLASLSPEWKRYTRLVRAWLKSQESALNMLPHAAENR